MTDRAISSKYYELLTKLYQSINSNNIRWSKALNAEYFTAELNYQFKMRVYKTIGNLAPKFLFKMYDDGGMKIFEITSEKNGKDEIEIDGKVLKVHDILEEIYEWARAYSLDIIEKVDKAGEVIDALTKMEGLKPPTPPAAQL